ncbi:unnamed protein product [Sphagnum balticum]
MGEGEREKRVTEVSECRKRTTISSTRARRRTVSVPSAHLRGAAAQDQPESADLLRGGGGGAFLRELQRAPPDWSRAAAALEAHLAANFSPSRAQQPTEEVGASFSRIPPLLIPSSKSINSSRYSGLSKEERGKACTS